MPFDLSCPTSATRIFREIEFEAMARPQPRCIRSGGDEFGAVQVEVAFTGSFFRQPQTMAEFELGLQKVALQPIDRALRQALIADDVGRGSGRFNPTRAPFAVSGPRASASIGRCSAPTRRVRQ